MKLNKLFALALTGIMLLSGTAAMASDLVAAEYLTGNYTKLPADGPVVSLILAHANAENTDAHAMTLAWKEALEFYSDGKINFTVYPNSQMGSDAEMIASLLAGDIDVVLQSGSMHVSQVPETAIFDTPFLTAGYPAEKIESVLMDSEFRDLYNAANEKAGMVCLMLKSVDTMNLTSNRAVNNIGDLKGLKIRTAQSPSRMALWSALGANPHAPRVQ